MIGTLEKSFRVPIIPMVLVLEHIVHHFQHFVGVVLVSFMGSFIWTSYWCALLDDSIFIELNGGKTVRCEVIILVVLGWVGLGVAVAMGTIMYFTGRFFKLQAFLFPTMVACAIAYPILQGVITANIAPTDQEKFEASLLIWTERRQRPDKITDWMRNANCADAASCGSAITDYVDYRVDRAFKVNVVFLMLISIGLLGLGLMVWMMGCVKPYVEPETSGELLTGEGSLFANF
jgi:hypothetical protein